MIRRRRLKRELVLVMIFTICTFTYLYSQIIKSDESEPDDISHHLPKKSLLSVESSPNSTTETWRLSTSTRKRYTTKSMSELGKMDAINPHFLFINWMAGNGAEMLVFLLEKVQGMNSFKHVRLKEAPVKHLTFSGQERIIEQMNAIRRDMAVPLSFDKNTDFINFTYFDKQSPTYLSVVRDPVIKMAKQKSNDDFLQCAMVSERNCSLTPNPEDLTIPSFCGHDPRCRVINSEWALETAKDNVIRFYPVVGVLEDFDASLKILEKKLPQFFRGSEEIFNSTLFDIFKRRKDPEISDLTRKKMDEVLETENNFYRWIKQRLTEQVASLL